MALHGALCRHNRWAGRQAYLVAARDVALAVPYLDEVAGRIGISAAQLLADHDSLVYQFRLAATGKDIASGRLTVTGTVTEEQR